MGIDDEHGARQAAHAPNAAHRSVQLLDLLGELASFLLREPLELACLASGLERLEALNASLDGHEVREQATEPTGVHVVLPGAGRLLADCLLGLLLRADEQNRFAAPRRLANELQCREEARPGLGQVDDVDPVALGKDVLAHLGIPAAGLVSEWTPASSSCFMLAAMVPPVLSSASVTFADVHLVQPGTGTCESGVL